MKTLKSPPLSALSIDQSRSTGSPLHLSGAFSMEKPKLIEDLGMQVSKDGATCKHHYGLFECSCGNTFRTRIALVNDGKSKSCGCHKKMVDKTRMIGNLNRQKHGLRYTLIYWVWLSIKARCHNPKNKSYARYGGKGISVCEEWRSGGGFVAFYNWATTHGYREGLVIDRRNTKGNYEPNNCWFTDHPISAQNKNLIMSTNTSGYRGICKSGKAWSAHIGWNRKNYYLGSFPTKELAAQAYNDFVIANKTHHPLNIIPNVEK